MNEFVRELKESAAGLHDGMGGHADHCAELMEKAAKHIAEMEENATAQALALKAAKAMQKAETERSDANQAKIDALMFEHCPDEMTEEQKHKWAISQAASKLTKPDIAALIAISNGEDLPNGK